MGKMIMNGIPYGGGEVEPNPTDTPTDELEKLKVGTTTYSILSSKVYGEATGDLITIEDAMEAPLEECKVTLEPQQAGTGDPSPSNVRPISGWDEVKVNVSPTQDAEDGTTYTIQLGSTCYGGELDVKSGVLKVTDGYIASYNGETLPSTWISDRDVYAPNTSPTTGAEVVYKLATPQEIQLTPTEVTLLRGINNLWSDGEMYVKYRRDIEMLLQRIADSLGGNA